MSGVSEDHDDSLVCSVSGGAHVYQEDEHGVRICACGEIELAPEEELTLIEIMHDARTAPLRPRSERKRFVKKIADKLFEADPEGFRAEFGERDEWIESVLDEQEEQYSDDSPR
jgi:hypothetical protein